jgi:flavodoxin I
MPFGNLRIAGRAIGERSNRWNIATAKMIFLPKYTFGVKIDALNRMESLGPVAYATKLDEGDKDNSQMNSIGIFYGTTTGDTERVAHKIAKALGIDISSVRNVSRVDIAETEGCPNLILGCPTCGMGDLQPSFESFLTKLKKRNLSGKKVAIFGCGDQRSYPDTFVDAIGVIYEAMQLTGCELVGKIPGHGYSFLQSKAQIENVLVGLPIDENNQADLTEARIERWITQLRFEFGL